MLINQIDMTQSANQLVGERIRLKLKNTVGHNEWSKAQLVKQEC
jgi:hypothetical protein